ncbi:hypothetical protein fugu_008867 [Takifugu bimaculatus]|uniref:Uncharacterized protein n=1 Tax=Takifugu bimaculatus TaxID=433685 RepID=A0A4Z2AYR7_9TELE|nr:hypothetical protein fugu_008867 [Takifugu bimaculatus]
MMTVNIDVTNFSSSWSDGLAFCASCTHIYQPTFRIRSSSVKISFPGSREHRHQAIPGHGGADEDRPARLAERHVVRLRYTSTLRPDKELQVNSSIEAMLSESSLVSELQEFQQNSLYFPSSLARLSANLCPAVASRPQTRVGCRPDEPPSIPPTELIRYCSKFLCGAFVNFTMRGS